MATSLHLQPHNAAEPFCPMMQLRDRRTAALEDFDDDAIAALRECLPLIEQPELRARIGDVIWVARRDYEMAQLAVAAYLDTAVILEDPDMWPPAMERIERAAQVAMALGRNSSELDAVQKAASAMLDRHNGQDPLFLSARLIELLLQIGGRDPLDMWEISGRVADAARSAGDWHRAETYRGIAAACRAAAGETEEADRDRIAAAEVLVEQAEAAANESYLVASAHLQRAIEALRRVSGTRDRVAELHETLIEYQRQSVSEMKPISVEIETKELTEGAVEAVAGLTWPEAFEALARVNLMPQFESLQASARKMVQEHPLQHLFSSMRLSEDGKVVARTPGAGLGDEEGLAAATRAAMFQEANWRHSLIGHAVIEPARRKINDEHDTAPEAVLSLLGDSPFVPESRRVQVARGISAGFDGDYLIASHLLVPQLENGIRWVLSSNGVQVTSLDNSGVQRERDLNYLLYQESTKAVLTPGVAFDLQALLVDPLGANFRNRLAHGLLSDGGFRSAEAAYVWWVMVFLIGAFRVAKPADTDCPTDP